MSGNESIENILDLTDDSILFRVFDTIRGIEKPAPVEDISDLALCSEEKTKNILDFFVILGIAENKTKNGNDVYYKNRDYFKWLRASKIKSEFSKEEIKELEKTIDLKIEVLQDIYKTNSPDNICIKTENEALIEHIQQDANRWKFMERTKRDINFAMMLEENK